jgi:hypothetical protein
MTALELFYINLGQVLRTSPESAKQLVQGYNSDDCKFFERYFTSLPKAGHNNNVNEKLNTNGKLNVGSYGLIEKKSGEPFVYKFIPANQKPGGASNGAPPSPPPIDWVVNYRLRFYKRVFKEIIIQTFLQSDRMYGKYICRLDSVYRDKDYDDDYDIDAIVILKLEFLKVTIDDYFMETFPVKNVTSKLNITNKRSDILKNMLLEILTVLIYFRHNYGFEHRDLRLKNVMFGFQNNLKLIDFGWSIINIDGISIGEYEEQSAEDSLRLCNMGSQIDNISGNLSKIFDNCQKQNNPSLEMLVSELQTKNTIKSAGSRKKRRNRKKTLKKIVNYDNF